MASVTLEDRLEVYRTFKAELTGYRFRGFAIRPEIHLQKIQFDLKAKALFDELKVRYADASGQREEFCRLWRPEQMWESFGAQATESLTTLQVGQIYPVRTDQGWYLVQLMAIEASYEQVSGAIDDLLYQSRRQSFLVSAHSPPEALLQARVRRRHD